MKTGVLADVERPEYTELYRVLVKQQGGKPRPVGKSLD
jgi:hypothetical protein